ncbi:MAG: potassium-transporting ATPase subunit KdpB [Thermoplasmatales archaeon]|nr:potassium-transporting ATPase subunit KdpB [Candidatus Thermoplasmatota archaeon]MCL6002577.1 potassium-transporting ATPase subunit KdpB [Candidatus Thermoplasmatota archaeon]MDA8055640.1 potassium-transporting ATPase subunit KdpB [Thermoplasmatales archaeon]
MVSDSSENRENRLNWPSILLDSLKRLSPYALRTNLVMFITELTFYIVLIMAIDPTLIPVVSNPAEKIFYSEVALILIITVWFSTLSDSIAEAQIRNTASSLRRMKEQMTAKRLNSSNTKNFEMVPSEQLRKGDLILIVHGDKVPIDSEVMQGIAMVDESLLTGESANVRKSVGSTLLGGSVVTTDSLVARVSTNPDETYVSKLISLVESSSRPKTPNEIALTILIAGFSAIFTIIIVTLLFLGVTLNLGIDLAVVIALYVCLLPTTIGALLPAIGISGINRMSVKRIIAKSGKAIEASGDTDALLLDKTGTITRGMRKAVKFVPSGKHTEREVGQAALLSSWDDDTPEGKSIVELAYNLGYIPHAFSTIDRSEFEEFSATTRRSSIKMTDTHEFLLPKGGRGILQRKRIRRKFESDELQQDLEIVKGAPDAIIDYVKVKPDDFDSTLAKISEDGATIMAVAEAGDLIGFIKLKDEVKPGVKEKIKALREMDIEVVMVTGDQPLTAGVISKDVGIDDYIAKARPETKYEFVKEEQKEGKIVSMIGDGTNDAPALSAADVGLAMASGTEPAKEAANMVDLESNPSKIIDVVMLGKQILMTRGTVTTFSIANDIAKYFVIVPIMFAALPELGALNLMHLTPHVAVISALIYNAIIIPALIPLALKGTVFKPSSTMKIFLKNVTIYGLGGIVLPFIAIKLIAILIVFLGVTV